MEKLNLEVVNIEEEPITDEWFRKTGWELYDDGEEVGDMVYWVLPLPKDNPDMNSPALVSSIKLNDEPYSVQIFDFNGLGNCENIREVETLYTVLTHRDIYEELEPKTTK